MVQSVFGKLQPELISANPVWAGIGRLFDWMSTVTEPTGPVQSVSFCELMIHWQMVTGDKGIRCTYLYKGNHSQWEAVSPHGNYDFASSVTNFAQYVGNILKTAWPCVARLEGFAAKALSLEIPLLGELSANPSR